MPPSEFTRDYLVHYYEIDRKRRLTIPALMHYFEDIATLHSEALGLTLERYFDTGQLFLLLKWDIAVRSRPAFNETIRISTRPTTFKRFLANRDYAVTGKSGTLLAEAKSVWAFTDMNLKRPVRVPGEICAAFGVPPETAASFDPLGDLEAIPGETPALPIRVGAADLDNNGHVNNVRYVEWALRSLPAGFVHDNEVSRVQVHYKKELKEGEEAGLATGMLAGERGPVSDHSLRSGETEICRLRLEWKT